MFKNITEVVINDQLLGWEKQTRTFTGMASDFKHKDLFSRIYDDAADVGFFLKNPKTGRKLLFVFAGENYAEEEVSSYEFSAFCLDHNPADLLDLKVTLFND